MTTVRRVTRRLFLTAASASLVAAARPAKPPRKPTTGFGVVPFGTAPFGK